MLQYLKLHTKVRRLGYLKLIVLQYLKNDFHSSSSFSNFIENIAGDNKIKKQLVYYDKYYYGDNKGVIEITGSGVSADPYVKLAEDLNIIAKINFSFILTKISKVYKVLLASDIDFPEKYKYNKIPQRKNAQLFLFTNEEDKNIFNLSTLDKIFLLKSILEYDFLYLKSILKIIYQSKNLSISKNGIKYYTLKENLITHIKQNIEDYFNSELISFNEKQKAYNFLKEFNTKEFKLRSFEGIVEPRIGWLIDLNLINGNKYLTGKLELSDQGANLFNKIKGTYNIVELLEKDYYKIFNFVYQVTERQLVQKDKNIDNYINESFSLFKTLAPNRITFSQAVNYTCISSLIKDGIVVEYKQIKDYLFETEGKKYIIDWFPSENDGSIKKVKL